MNLAVKQYRLQAEKFLLFPDHNYPITVKHGEITYEIPIKIIALWMQNLPKHEILAYIHNNITTQHQESKRVS